ncbi:MAG TPA: methionine--tRNA ligase [Chthonomonas sp.]|jgi:methionyl-tRNA synthetase|uniref:methionine--tRNA ligase n=1 Tax=Chthonomonas sp. TaxID=2282153 RepID=UPI002B4AD54B|nr:methionine--tRNA ligase [Chthonomonas sp.]HLH81578.1 methionine--tRNA ligase [Chthonomonas sp.]
MTVSAKTTYYVTTPIYYVNGQPHIGTALTTVACDAIARHRRLCGQAAFLLTGTDENGTKIQEAAEKANTDTMLFVDRLSAAFQKSWQELHIAADGFIRTTEPRHRRAVQEFFRRLRDRGYVYKDIYEGWYSVSDETFYRDSDVENGVAKETGKPVVRVKEENYFFRLSAFADKLLEHIHAHPEFLLPDFRRNEVIRFIEEGLRDICITRANRGWGIPFPEDESKVIYVWFDALISYLSGIGWPDDPAWQTRWPADLHFMGKEIFVRFHATLWPAMLMAVGLPLPKQVYAHGFWTIPGLKPGEKAGKSTGGLPHPTSFSRFLAERAGIDFDLAADAQRYLLCREMNFGLDTEFSVESFLRRFNTDLANDLGNLLNRTLNMVNRYTGGFMENVQLDPEIGALAATVHEEYQKAMAEFRLNGALEAVFRLVGRMNKYLDEKAPWSLAKAAESGDAAAAAQLRTVLGTSLEATRLSALLLSPFMPVASERLLAQMGLSPPSAAGPQALKWGAAGSTWQVKAPQPLFPRIQNLNLSEKDIATLMTPPEDAETQARPAGAPVPPEEIATSAPNISIEEFQRVQLVVGEVLAAEPVPNTTKLLRLTVQLSEEDVRTILAGIAEFYKPEELVGRQVVIVANLQPRRMRGIESQGMLLAADVDGRAVLLQPDRPVPNGTRVR